MLPSGFIIQAQPILMALFISRVSPKLDPSHCFCTHVAFIIFPLVKGKNLHHRAIKNKGNLWVRTSSKTRLFVSSYFCVFVLHFSKLIDSTPNYEFLR